MFAVLLIILIPFIGYWLFKRAVDRVFDLPVVEETVRNIGHKKVTVQVSKND